MTYLVSPFRGLSRFNSINRDLDRWFTDDSRWTPHVDIAESETAYTLVADLPGVRPENIEINIDKGVLTIRGERNSASEENNQGVKRRERSHGSFVRQFSLPESADQSGISATTDHGVLTVTIEKVKNAQPISIEVKAA